MGCHRRRLAASVRGWTATFLTGAEGEGGTFSIFGLRRDRLDSPSTTRSEALYRPDAESDGRRNDVDEARAAFAIPEQRDGSLRDLDPARGHPDGRGHTERGLARAAGAGEARPADHPRYLKPRLARPTSRGPEASETF